MRVRDHHKIFSWPAGPGGTLILAERPQSESQVIVREVYEPIHFDHDTAAVKDWITMSAEFMGHLLSYEISTKESGFAKRLAAFFSKHVGCSLQQLGDLNIDF